MLKKLFGFDPKVTTVRTEILAGVTTFLTMSYILAVNPSMFSLLDGMSAGAVFTATALAAVIGSLVMAIWAKMPFGLAPGMGLNAFFTYTVCLGMGYTWQEGLAIVLMAGVIFLVISVSPLRSKIIESIPSFLKSAISAGIGLFIAFIGLLNVNLITFGSGVGFSISMTTGSTLGRISSFLASGIRTVSTIRMPTPVRKPLRVMSSRLVRRWAKKADSLPVSRPCRFLPLIGS